MKYLKFFTQREVSTLEDCFQMNFAFVISDSAEYEVINFEISNVKSIAVRLSGKEEASLRGTQKNYEIEPAFFEIAKNYLIRKVNSGEEIKENEEVFIDASEYFNLDAGSVTEFHKETIKIYVDD